METLLQTSFTEILRIIGFALLFTLPLFAVGFWLIRERKLEREQLIDPFTDLPRRPPGESLRQKIDLLSEDFDS